MFKLKKPKLLSFILALNCLSVFDISSMVVRAEHGGQDLFTSLAQLEELWKNDIKVVQQMEDTIRKMETAVSALKS